MKKIHILLFTLFSVFLFIGCDDYESPERRQQPRPDVLLYNDIFDPIKDNGQYIMPEMTVKPKRYWNMVWIANQGGRNNLGATDPNQGLQYHLLGQSIAGIANRAVQQGKSQIGVWMNDGSNNESYKLSKESLKNMGIEEQGMQSAHEIARNDYGPSGGIPLKVKDYIDGYVLTDVANNPESAIVASTAAHVYNSIIVDVRDEAMYSGMFAMKYDARNKTTRDAWNEFKDKCSNKALVVMPVQTGEMRDFAIMNDLFVINLNKKYGTASGGQNTALFEEILAWLAPGAPVYGWEQGVGEDEFVSRVTKNGHPMVPCDWVFNMPFTSINYKERQQNILAKVTNPQFIDYDKNKRFVSYYLSDGDNVQWMMTSFGNEEYYRHPQAGSTHMTFGMPIVNLSMAAPSQFANLINSQPYECSIIEALGGGYYYADTFSEKGNRAENLKRIAGTTAAHMRQHRVKILGLVAMDVKSPKAKEAYQEFVSANDQLEGIVVIQYSPYAGGAGEIFWVTNSKGYDIPVVTVKYSLWNFGNYNNEREGTPAYIASKMKNDTDENKFSAVAVHAWSKFKDIGDSSDPLAENTGGSEVGAGAAKLCQKHLGDDFEAVNIEELIWRIRMHYRKDQTLKYLSEVF